VRSGRLLWLSVAAAVVTMALKALAWQLTGSVGFLSDALESVVNLVAALVALLMLQWASRPPDEQHRFGHEKAEYFSAGFEGGLILLAAVSIVWAAVGRLLQPQALTHVATGVAVSAAASAVNLVVGLVLVRAGRRDGSIAVEADGRHLLTDVWTSVGVIAGVTVAAATGVRWVDSAVALLVALNIAVTGVSLIRRSGAGLMDSALPAADQAALGQILASHRRDGVSFRAVRTRQAGRRSFVSLEMLVPGAWTVSEAHELADDVEREIEAALPGAEVTTHVEPTGDRRAARRGGKRPAAAWQRVRRGFGADRREEEMR
jgi:cation diffusion facilitator family transporter